MGSICRSIMLSPCTLSLYILHICKCCDSFFSFWYVVCLFHVRQMTEGTFIGFADDASRHTQNLASVAWVIYSPTGQLAISGGACLGPAMNNVVEYTAMIELRCDAISNGILCLEVRLDSQLVVMQLNGEYHVHDPVMLRYYLCVRLLERHFVYINYEHILRNQNTTTDALANYVLYWHLNHNIT